MWPTSHHLLHACRVGNYGDLDVEKLRRLIQQCDQFEDFRTSLRVEHQPRTGTQLAGHPERPPLPSLGSPLQLRMQPGDVVLLHPDLAHCGAPNFGSAIRQMVYFRVKIQTPVVDKWKSWEEVEQAQATHMFADLLGVRSRLGEETDRLCALFQTTDLH